MEKDQMDNPCPVLQSAGGAGYWHPLQPMSKSSILGFLVSSFLAPTTMVVQYSSLQTPAL